MEISALNSITLTATQRLAHHLRLKYDQYQAAQGKITWPSLIALPIQQWLSDLWQTSVIDDARALLTGHQEELLWQKLMIEQAPELPVALSTQIRQAWQIIHQWNIPLVEIEKYQLSESMLFLKLANHFDAYCKTEKIIDYSSLINELKKKINVKNVKLPKMVYLAGFDEYSIQLQELLHVLRKYTEIISISVEPVPNSSIKRTSIIDTKTEIETAACWAKYHYQNKSQKIGIVIPNLAIHTNLVEKTFKQVFDNQSTHFDISLGKPLSHYPIIQHALFLLKLNIQSMTANEASYFLRSPFIAGANEELNARALLAAALSTKGDFAFTAEQLAQKATKQCSQLTHIFTEYLKVKIDIHASHSPEIWLAYFSAQLKAMGWPGSRTLTSTEYQVLERWQELLLEFAALKIVRPIQSLAEAIHSLEYLATHSIFRIKNSDAAIQIMGALETAGLEFDKLWVMGCDDIHWPPINTQTNPFIPLAIQKKYGVPASSSNQQMSFYRKITQRLCNSATETIFSYAAQEGEEIHQASVLIIDLPILDVNSIPIASYNTQASQQLGTCELETIVDEQGLSVIDKHVSGGTGIFKDQAACPFRAYVKHRLNTKPSEIVHLGLDAKQRGIVLHRILEKIWTELKTKQELEKYSAQALQNLVNTYTEKNLIAFINDEKINVSKNFIELEKKYLSQLIKEWLEYEKQRPEFSVLAIEQEQHLSLGELDFKVKIDRVDQTADGELIIDYKTGKDLSAKYWQGNRPDEPQLPLYCIANKTHTHGIAFAQIHTKEMAMIQFSAEHKDWHTQVIEWEKVLLQLAEDFKNGKAQRDPKHGEETCKNCNLQSVCRIYEERS